MELVIALMFGSAIAALALGLSSLTAPRPVQRRLARLSGKTTVAVLPRGDEEGVLAERQPNWLVRILSPFAGAAAKRREPSTAPLRRRLIQAGYRGESALVVYMGSRIALALILPALVAFSPFVFTLGELQLAVLMCVAAGVGITIPSFWVDRRLAARQKRIVLGLPDALDLMVVCVEAGLGINASLARVSTEFARTNPILASEFELVSLEIRAGKTTTDALRALAERTGVRELSTLVAMLVQTERFGTSLADTLRVHADSMRVQRMLRAEEQAAKAPLKMLFPTVLIFVAVLVVTIGPGMIQMFGFFGGDR
jgi:tight adherence protein C